MNDLLECPICGAEVKRQRATLSIQVSSRSVPVEGEYSTCTGCGEAFFAPGEMDRAMRSASSVIRDEEWLLQPEEIRVIREDLGFSQAEFERLLGVGQKSVARWEKGTGFQNGAADTLMRVARDVPGCAAYLREHAGLASSAKSQSQASPPDRVRSSVPQPTPRRTA